MRPRLTPVGDKNIVGTNIRKLRRLNRMTQKELAGNMQNFGVNINLTSLSKLEWQTRAATDKEIYAISRIFHVKADELFKEI